jgi:Fe-S-cluster containining protein
VTRFDAARLRRGLERLTRSDPGRAAAVVARAHRAREALEPGFPGEVERGSLTRDESKLNVFFERHRELACPALDPHSGRCELYEFRPIACRTYGPPLSHEGRPSEPCGLCFRGVDAATVERCRFEPDPEGLERTILIRLGVAPGEEWETLIALALARESAC